MSERENEHGQRADAIPLREYIAPVLSLIVGVGVLLPSAIGPIGRPFVWSWLLPIFIGASVVSMVCLVVAFVLSSWGGRSTAGTHRMHGIGNFSALGSLLMLATFLMVNYHADLSAQPRVLNIKVNPSQPETGKVVEVELEVQNRTGRPIRYEWEFDGKSVAGLRTAYIKMPVRAGSYLVTARLMNMETSAGVEAGASAPQPAPTHSATEGVPTVRTWIEVTESRPAGPASEPAPPATIVQICNGGTTYARQKTPLSPRKGASGPTQQPTRNAC